MFKKKKLSIEDKKSLVILRDLNPITKEKFKDIDKSFLALLKNPQKLITSELKNKKIESFFEDIYHKVKIKISYSRGDYRHFLKKYNKSPKQEKELLNFKLIDSINTNIFSSEYRDVYSVRSLTTIEKAKKDIINLSIIKYSKDYLAITQAYSNTVARIEELREYNDIPEVKALLTKLEEDKNILFRQKMELIDAIADFIFELVIKLYDYTSKSSVAIVLQAIEQVSTNHTLIENTEKLIQEIRSMKIDLNSVFTSTIEASNELADSVQPLQFLDNYSTKKEPKALKV